MRPPQALGQVLCFLTILNACIGSLALLPSGLIFPLYIYPGDNCVAWAPLISAIQTHSTLQFYVVVNPNSGPGAGTQPDTTYQACITSLRTNGAAHGNNVKILGYVATGYGTSRTVSQVTADVDTYSGWASAYRPEGIFFDEVAQAASLLPTYQTYATKVHTDFGTSFIILNPGAKPDAGYFSIANLVVTFEGFYNTFSPSLLTIGTSTPANKQAVIIHDGPAQIPKTFITNLSSTLHLGASFITDKPNAVAYNQFPTDWTNIVNNIVSVQA